MISVELRKLVKDCLTQNDGTSYCPFRVGGAIYSGLSFPAFIFGAIYSTIREHHFDYIGFGTSFGMMMGGIALLAGGVALKAKTDPIGNQP